MQSRPAEVSHQAGASGPPSDDDMQRAQVYSLMAALLAAPPHAELLNRLRQIGDSADRPPDTPLAVAWTGLKAAVTESNEVALDDEFHALFIGIGRGELMPYASWYLTGFLMERPLAALRQDLKTLGFERQPGVGEPEDHAAALCEVMSMIIASSQGPDIDWQCIFFGEHMAWLAQFFIDMQKAEAARFYRAVGQFGEQFMTLEKEYLAMTI